MVVSQPRRNRRQEPLGPDLEECGNFADDDDDREPEYESADDRLGQEFGDPSDPEHAGGVRDQALSGTR